MYILHKGAITDFRFMMKGILKKSDLVGFCGNTSRRRYVFCPVTATPSYAEEMDESGVYIWIKGSCPFRHILGCVETFIHNWGHLVSNFRTEFIREHAELYADSIKDIGALLYSYVGFY